MHDALLLALMGPCPECGNGRLRAVQEGALTNLSCPSCGSCWHAERGFVRRVDPATCAGCEDHAECDARQADRTGLVGSA